MAVQVILPLSEKVSVADLRVFLACIPDAFDATQELRYTDRHKPDDGLAYLAVELHPEDLTGSTLDPHRLAKVRDTQALRRAS